MTAVKSIDGNRNTISMAAVNSADDGRHTMNIKTKCAMLCTKMVTIVWRFNLNIISLSLANQIEIYLKLTARFISMFVQGPYL